MKILFVASEIVPFSKTGGLADVAGALPKSLKNLGHDIRVITPKYKMTDKGNFSIKLIMEDLDVAVGNRIHKAQIYETKMPNTDVTVYFVGNDEYFDRNELYQENGRDYSDNAERFVFFSKAVLLFLKASGWEPHIIHANDWQSALVSAYIKTIYSRDTFFNTIATVYTIHNMGYMGLFPASKMPVTGLPWKYFTPDSLEFWGNVCFAKAGLVYSDVINTVSRTYAQEIQTQEFGHGLDGLIRGRMDDVFGITNGCDYDVWDPSKDMNLQACYSAANIRGKITDKSSLRKTCALPAKKDVPIIGMVSRMEDQKGFDILHEAFSGIMKLPVQFVLLGTGDPKYHNIFLSYAEQYSDKISINIGFDSAQAPQIYAGSDMFLMPSRYEPCGLGQFISFKYGTVPIVRSTGGLADTVSNFDSATEQGDGFVFEDYSGPALHDTVRRAVSLYASDKKRWNRIVKKVMNYDFSWDSSAKKYVALYKKAIEKLKINTGATKQQKQDGSIPVAVK